MEEGSSSCCCRCCCVVVDKYHHTEIFLTVKITDSKIKIDLTVYIEYGRTDCFYFLFFRPSERGVHSPQHVRKS